jgi:hypothetical protein
LVHKFTRIDTARFRQSNDGRNYDTSLINRLAI